VNNMAKKEKNGAATAVGCLGAVIGIGCVIVGFVWSVRIIVDQWGIPMGGVAVLVFPATLAIMPWYAGLVLGNWWLLALVWGGGLVGQIFGSMAQD
jgi:CBS-domain-containing membrane protein